MANLFIVNMNELTDDDWNSAKQLKADDKIIFIIEQDAEIPIKLIPCIRNIKSEPDFEEWSGIDTTALAFMLGMKCSNFAGTCYLLSQDNIYENLDGFQFEISNTEINIFAMSCLKDAINDVIKRDIRSSSATTDIKEEIVEEKEDTSIIEETIDFSIPYDDSEDPECPEEFAKYLKKLSTSKLDLLKYKNAIAYCVENSDENLIDMFEFHINTRLAETQGEALAKLVYKTLKPHYEHLVKLLLSE